jgi:LmbE family N-acetylglucosaminyl deacetylase
METILVIAPHPDDESIGCGGSIALEAGAGRRVVVLFLTSGELGINGMEPAEARATREHEAEDAAAVLGLARLEFARLPDYNVAADMDSARGVIARMLDEERPTTIYVPHDGDQHPDHSAAASALRLASHDHDPSIALGYEVWTPVGDLFSARDVTNVMRTKLEAIRAHRSQLMTYRYDRAIWGLNRYRGVMTIRRPFAEAFAAVPLGKGAIADASVIGWRYV